jgi:hypothetical protein
MRRLLFFLMFITGILTIISGIVEALSHPHRLPVAHIAISCIFALTLIVHLFINGKAVMKYIVGR